MAAAALERQLGVPLPVTPGTTAWSVGVDVLWMGTDEWLVVADDGAVGTAEELQAAAGPQATVVDVSAQRTIVELAGAASRELLAQGCALDLHPRAFAPGACAQTLLARAGAVLVCRSAEPCWWILVRASFAAYLAEWLIDAAAGCAPVAAAQREPAEAAA